MAAVLSFLYVPYGVHTLRFGIEPDLTPSQPLETQETNLLTIEIAGGTRRDSSLEAEGSDSNTSKTVGRHVSAAPSSIATFVDDISEGQISWMLFAIIRRCPCSMASTFLPNPHELLSCECSDSVEWVDQAGSHVLRLLKIWVEVVKAVQQMIACARYARRGRAARRSIHDGTEWLAVGQIIHRNTSVDAMLHLLWTVRRMRSPVVHWGGQRPAWIRALVYRSLVPILPAIATPYAGVDVVVLG